MEYLFIYFLQIFDKVTAYDNVLSFCTMSMIVVYLFTYIIFLIEKDCDSTMKAIVAFFKKITICCLSLTVIITFIPTKNTLLLMGGMYLGKKTVNTIITDEKIKKVDTIINLELDKRIGELKKETNQ